MKKQNGTVRIVGIGRDPECARSHFIMANRPLSDDELRDLQEWLVRWKPQTKSGAS